jgi:hypothetical protein
MKPYLSDFSNYIEDIGLDFRLPTVDLTSVRRLTTFDASLFAQTFSEIPGSPPRCECTLLVYDQKHMQLAF